MRSRKVRRSLTAAAGRPGLTRLGKGPMRGGCPFPPTEYPSPPGAEQPATGSGDPQRPALFGCAARDAQGVEPFPAIPAPEG